MGKLSGFRGEAFELSRGRFRALVGRLLGEGFGLWWEDSGLSWGEFGVSFVGVRAFVGRNSAFRIDFTNLKLRAALLKRINFAHRIDFTKLELRAASLKRELAWAPSCAGEP